MVYSNQKEGLLIMRVQNSNFNYMSFRADIQNNEKAKENVKEKKENAISNKVVASVIGGGCALLGVHYFANQILLPKNIKKFNDRFGKDLISEINNPLAAYATSSKNKILKAILESDNNTKKIDKDNILETIKETAKKINVKTKADSGAFDWLGDLCDGIFFAAIFDLF